MCLSKVYLKKANRQETVMEEVSAVKVSGDEVKLTTLTGEEKVVNGVIKEIDFLTHSITLED